MPTREERGQKELHDSVLPDDDLGKLLLKSTVALSEVFNLYVVAGVRVGEMRMWGRHAIAQWALENEWMPHSDYIGRGRNGWGVSVIARYAPVEGGAEAIVCVSDQLTLGAVQRRVLV